MIMYDLFIQTALMISLGVIVYLVALTLPRIPVEEKTVLNGSDAKKRTLTNVLRLDEIDNRLKALKDKTLRRIKVLIMKADNFISKRLNNGGDKI